MKCAAMVRPWLLALLCMSQISVSAWGQAYRFRVFGIAEGLRNLSVLSIGQDQAGYIWIGTLNGVYRYDGVQFQQFGIPEGLPGSKVVSLAAAPDGSFWAGTDGGLALWSGKKWTAVDFGQPVVLEGQGSLVGDSQRGVLWVATHQGLGLVHLGKDRKATPLGKMVFQPEADFRSVGLDAENHVWCGGRGVLFQSRQSHGMTVSKDFRPALNEFPQDSWESIVSDPGGNLWIRSASHLLCWEKTTGKLRQAAALPVSIFGGLGFLPGGILAVPTNFGLERLEGGRWSMVSARNGLPVDSVSSVFVDREGSPWIGTNGGGVARWQGYGSWEGWTAPSFLENDSVWSIVEDLRGELWFGTDRGVVHFVRGRNDSGGQLKTAIPTKSFPIALAIDNKDSLWIATAHHGLQHCQFGTLSCETMTEENGLPPGDLTGLVCSRTGALWVSTRRGLFVTAGDSGIPRFRHESLPRWTAQSEIRSLTTDDAGQVLVTGDGLWIGGASHWSRFTTSDGLLSGKVDQVQTSGRSVWVSYSHRIGISRLEIQPGEAPRWTHYDTNNGLSSNFIYLLGSDAQGRVWAGTDVGLDVLSGGRWKHYSTENGLIWQDFNTRAFLRDRRGSLWFGTSHGLAHFSDRGVPDGLSLPVPVIRDAEVNGKRQAVSEWIETPSGRGDVTVKFSALSFLDESKTRFRYRVQGLQEEWRETDETNVHFPDLQPGRYRFELIAKTGAGLSSAKPASLSILVPAPWWRTQWFRAAVVIGALGFFRLLWIRKTRRLVARQRELEMAVTERTRDLLVERENLLQAREAYAYQANHDALTGLYNRAFLNYELPKQILCGRKIAILWLDLDKFKCINDLFGHDAGDAVLQEVAKRLREAAGESSVIARLGGDEFVVLLFDLNRAAACASASRIVELLAEPCQVGGQAHCVTASVGVSMHPEHGSEAKVLLRNADLAMYRAKNGGKNGYMYFNYLDYKLAS